MADRTALVVGVTGVVGRAFLDVLAERDDWAAIGVSRRPPEVAGKARHVAVDLLDEADCRAKLGALGDVTHVLYCAFHNAPSQAEQVAPNLAMLRNVLAAIDPAAAHLRRVVLIEGNKWYGSHLGPFKTPAKEDDPRSLPPMFYFDQEDHLVARQQGRPWQWVALRPHTICGFSLFSAMNIMTAIGVYATISKGLGLPLRFPGKPGAYRAVYQACEARHLAKGILWAMTADAAANQAFNITNGDFFRWENLWPVFADFFAMPAGPVHTLSLTDYMADKAPLWGEIVARHGLQPYPYADLVAWPFADYVFGCDWDVMSSTTKIRQAGFQDVVDSESMFLRLFQEFRDARIIP